MLFEKDFFLFSSFYLFVKSRKKNQILRNCEDILRLINTPSTAEFPLYTTRWCASLVEKHQLLLVSIGRGSGGEMEEMTETCSVSVNAGY